MEDDLNILKVEYVSNRFLDPTPILNLSLDDQTVFFKSSKWRWTQNIKSGISQQPLYGLWLMRGKLEEFGSGWPTSVLT